MNRHSVTLLLLVCCLVTAAPRLFAGATATDLKTQAEKESYSIGYQVGLSMKTDGVDVSFEKVVQGLQDAIADKEPPLSTGEMRTLIVDLKKRARESQSRKIQEQAAQNARESQQFLDENRKKEGIRTTPSGLQYKVLKEGDGIQPKAEDFVKVNYRGTFIDGKEFDSSYAKGEPVRVKVGSAIKGWTEALPMMKVGSKWQLFIPPHLAYGRGRAGGRIPPNKVLLFEVELLAVDGADKGDRDSARSVNIEKVNGKEQLPKTP